MKKNIIFGGLGIISIIVAIALFFLFLNSLNDGANLLYFGGAIVFTAVMVFSFIKANAPEIHKEEATESAGEGMNKLLETNNAMIKEFNTTERNKEHLRMLEQAGEMVKN